MKKYLFFPAVAMIIFVACNQKEMDFNKEPVTEPEIETVQMTFRAATEDAPTKTTLDEGTGAVAWAVGDTVKFVYELNKKPGYITSEALTAEDIDGEGVATFTANLPKAFTMTEEEYKAVHGSDSTLHLYAVSPSSIDIDYSSASSFLLTVPTEQDGSFKNASIALAKWNKNDPSATLEFKNLCGLLKFTIADDAVCKVVLHSDDYIAGKMDISFTGPAVKNVKDGKKTITVNVSGAGTYYIAVLPTDAEKGIGINNIYVELFDEDDNLIGDKASANPLVIARKQIRSIGTLATADRMYFKADGTGKGSSWEDAGGVTLLKSTMKSASVVTKNLYLAAGDYNITDTDVSPTVAGCKFSVYGGYPASATGKSLAGRDVANNISRIISDEGKRSLRMNKGNWILDGLTFTSQGYPNDAVGCALLLMTGIESVTLNNCTFKDSIHGAAGKTISVGGAIRVACTATFTNCKFINNNSVIGSAGAVAVVSGGTFNATNCYFSGNSVSSSKYGGAIYDAGTINLEKCYFEDNTAAGSGGAIFVTSAGTAKLKDVTFINNYSSTNGGVIYGQGTTGSGAKVFMDGCYINYTNSSKTGTGQIISMNHAETVWGMNNTLMSGGWGGTAKAQIQNLGNGIIVNSTLFEQCSSPNITNAASATLVIANSIVVNGASSGNGNSFTNVDGGSLTVDHSLYNKLSSGAISTNNGSLGGVKVGLSGNFPGTGVTAWYKTNADTMYANDQSSTVTVSDCRENIHFYSWDGTIPAAIGDFSKTNSTSLSSVVSTANSEFATWLGENLVKDIRGVARNTSAMWPGSYEQASSAASAPAFTLK